ncbi:MAG TPA: sulfotransferase family 2 domain-containing protein [Sphingomicrobium sp.]|nr:sulfotransferase family 2 domain-containing protein [Sphingomicrobium sp.]
MIISYKHKFVFAAVPKTGTHAVRQALRAHLGPDDIEQVGLFVQKKFPMPELAALQHGHISLLQLRPHMDPGEFESFFKFAFVRNPFDRFVSYCSFMTRFRGEFLANPQRVMAHFLQNPPRQHVLFWPQYSFICDSNGELLADHVGRVEEMQQSYDEIASRLGIPSQALEKVNTSTRNDYRGYYTPALVDGVARLYARDLELFGYEF